MRTRLLALVLFLTLLLGAGVIPAPRVVEAHQPFCEFADLTVTTPWQIKDPMVSLAYYANIYPGDDVDYFTFDAEAGQSIYVQMTIPSIEGQEPSYVPMMAVFGPGLAGEETEIPARVTVPAQTGVLVVSAIDEPEEFYEPFGRQYYWIWQDINFSAPQTGTYMVAVWHPAELIGRYTFVIGKQEVFGGELDCFMSMDDYFTPLVVGTSPYRDAVQVGDDHAHSDDHDDDHNHTDGDVHD